MNDTINISKGDIPETDAEVEKILAKKKPTTKRKLSLVQTPKKTIEASVIAAHDKEEGEADLAVEQSANAEKQPVQTIANVVLPHTEIVWHPAVNGLDVYGYTSQQILDVADKVYTLYNQTPIIQLSGDVLVGSKVVRLKYEAATYVNVTDDHWHLTFSDVDIEPLNGTFPKTRVGINKPDALERWEKTPERQSYRNKLLYQLAVCGIILKEKTMIGRSEQ
jgi:hypothetical protein